MTWTLGIDIACRAAHVATLLQAGNRKATWTNMKFTTDPADLDRVWRRLDGIDPAEITVVLEPTRNAWITVAEWFRRKGTRVVMVPATQSAALRDYMSAYVKNDKADSELLARLPVVHPEELPEYHGQGPADPLRRLVKQRDSLVKRRTAIYSRIDAQLEILGPAWYAALGSTFSLTALHFLTQYANPHKVIRLGATRLTALLRKRSGGRLGADLAAELLAAARTSIDLWGADGMDFAALGLDIGYEAKQALFLTDQLADIDSRLDELYTTADPKHIIDSAPGVGKVGRAVIAGRIGDITRFHSLPALRSYAGLIPAINQSGTSGYEGSKITKAGDPLLRSALFTCADHARRTDPQLAAKYHQLKQTRHHNSALCHIAAILITRIGACMREQQTYQIRDINGDIVTAAQGRELIKERYPKDTKETAGQESQESSDAPTAQPATTNRNRRKAA